jgi:hypothetical protein
MMMTSFMVMGSVLWMEGVGLPVGDLIGILLCHVFLL